jgi:hypothetical protein
MAELGLASSDVYGDDGYSGVVIVTSSTSPGRRRSPGIFWV